MSFIQSPVAVVEEPVEEEHVVTTTAVMPGYTNTVEMTTYSTNPSPGYESPPGVYVVTEQGGDDPYVNPEY